MPVLELLVGLAILAGVAVVASGRAGAAAPAAPDRPALAWPADRALTADDLAEVRFAVGFRGYRMDQVDALLDRLQREWAEPEAPRDGHPADAG
jgi:DivIVA domain-containing protein